jgi:competence protein ComEA
MERLSRARSMLAGLLLNLTALGLAVWWLRAPAATAVRVLPPPTATPAPSPTPPVLLVYVSGAVARPDVVRLAEGARAADAVAAAGGLTDAADPAAVNLAAPLADGTHLHVPAHGEAPGTAAGGTLPAGLPAGSAASAGGLGGGPGGGAPLDLNRATAAELEALPGIGPALAGRILEHRAAQGPFREVRGLLEVPGVGEKTLERFADRLVVR